MFPVSTQDPGVSLPYVVSRTGQIFKIHTKGKKEKKMPKIITELPSPQNSLWDCPTEGRLPEKVLRKRRSCSHPRSFCFELDPLCLPCQEPKPRLIIRLGDLSSRARGLCTHGCRGTSWDCLTAYKCSLGAGEVLRGAPSLPPLGGNTLGSIQ